MTPTLPQGESLLLRTDFTDDTVWQQILDAVNQSYEPEGLDLMYGLTVVDNSDFQAMTTGDLAELLTSQYYVYIVDERTMKDPEHPILAVDTTGDPQPSDNYPTFRIVPREMAMMEVNLTLANSDFEDFASTVDDDGVYRGFEH